MAVQTDEKETDPNKLAQRQKQIDLGKNTVGYDRYVQDKPKYAHTTITGSPHHYYRRPIRAGEAQVCHN